jgi:hypothetical protein
MKHLLLIIALLNFMVSTAYAAENLNGKGLECDRGDGVLYFGFGPKNVWEWYINYSTPLKIEKKKLSEYGTYPEGIYWSYTPLYSYQLLRKNLQLNLSYWGKGGKEKVTEYKCYLTTHKGLQKTLNKEIEKIKASMKKNKL